MSGQAPLNAHDQNLFKRIIKYYEDKEYKKALKDAEDILKRRPDHGETLAMKGLVLKSLKRTEEAYDFAKQGLTKNMNSHICWHVYGLLYRDDRNYPQAIKSYLNALKKDPDNIQILRDLALLQVHLRDLSGHLESRMRLLHVRPSQRQNWMGLAVAHHLVGNYDTAIKILDTYEQVVDETPREKRDEVINQYQYSELHLYKNRLMREKSDYQAALDHLNKMGSAITDTVLMSEMKAECLLKLNDLAGAKEEYLTLLKLNGENYDYFRGYQLAHELPAGFLPNMTSQDASLKTPVVQVDANELNSSETVEKLTALYDSLTQIIPKSLAVKRIPLDFTSGEVFRSKLAAFVRPFLRKSIPSLFSFLKALYSNAEKVAIIESLFLSYLESIKSTGKFPDEQESTDVEAPTVLLWIYYYLAHHYDRLRKPEEALRYIDAAIAHTPTVLDLYLCKARIYKHAGNLHTAAELVGKARKLDLADRYLNTKHTKYLLRIDNVSEANATIALFTRGDTEAGASNNLYDMQAMWYEIEIGNSYRRLQEYGRALRKFYAVRTHFKDIREDQFDFHSFALRENTLCTYVDMLKWEESLFSTMNFAKAAVGIVKTYVDIFDLKAQGKELKLPTSPVPKSKDKDKDKEKEGESKKRDKDPDGIEKATTPDPLGKATKVLKQLEANAPLYLDTHLCAFELYLRKQKYLLALRAVKSAVEIASANHPEVHKIIVRLFHQVDNVASTLPAPVSTILQEARATLLADKSPHEYNAAFLAAINDDDANVVYNKKIAAAEMILLLSDDRQQAASLLTDIGSLDINALQSCIRASSLLKESLNDTSAHTKFVEACRTRFPFAAAFKE